MDNNIFDFGKSELTHDAIISWIINGFNYKETAEELYNISVQFIKLMDSNFSFELYNKVEIKNQFNIKINTNNIEGNSINKRGRIDIFAIFSGPNGKYYLIVEDKIFSGENGNQFVEYIEAIENNQDLMDGNKKFVNIILGNYPEYYIEKVRKNGWEVVNRKEILKLLPVYDSYHTPELSLLRYYRNYLDKLDKDYSSYMTTKDFNNWTRFAILGFFSDLISEYENSDFGIINNRNGGFCGLWFKKEEIVTSDLLKYNIYLQLEFTPSNKSEWFISVKLEDLLYTSASINKARTLKAELYRLLNDSFEEVRYSKGSHLTVGKKNVKSEELESLKKEISDSFNSLNLVIRKLDIIFNK